MRQNTPSAFRKPDEYKKKGYKTAILDGDITGPSVPKAFGLNEEAVSNGEALIPVATRTGIDVMSVNLLLENEIDPVVWRGPVISGAVKQFWSEVIWGDVDTMFIDMPPGTGDVTLTFYSFFTYTDHGIKYRRYCNTNR